MDFERLRFSEVLARVDPEEAEAAVYRVASKGLLKYPKNFDTYSHFMDVVRVELPGLVRASAVFDDVIQEQGWSKEHDELLSAGFEMAIVVLHEMVRESRRIGY